MTEEFKIFLKDWNIIAKMKPLIKNDSFKLAIQQTEGL